MHFHREKFVVKTVLSSEVAVRNLSADCIPILPKEFQLKLDVTSVDSLKGPALSLSNLYPEVIKEANIANGSSLYYLPGTFVSINTSSEGLENKKFQTNIQIANCVSPFVVGTKSVSLVVYDNELGIALSSRFSLNSVQKKTEDNYTVKIVNSFHGWECINGPLAEPTLFDNICVLDVATTILQCRSLVSNLLNRMQINLSFDLSKLFKIYTVIKLHSSNNVAAWNY